MAKIRKIEGLRLFNLKALILNNNNISQIENLEQTKELSTLILSHNQISEMKGMEKLKKLTKLSLSHNKIHVIALILDSFHPIFHYV